ncbi:MAG: CZB domain-containing protein, partial [Limisphaera sp.]|nr:CZB domain-containing protein [Limisphaera sp.]
VDELVAEIAAASQEQSQGISQINAAVSQMDKVTQANAAAAEQSAAAARELQSQAETLRAAVQQLQAMVGRKSATTSSGAASSTVPNPAGGASLKPLPRESQAKRTRSQHLPPLDTDQLERQLTRAMAAHGAWKRRLEEAIRSGQSDLTPEQAGADNQCEFGKWLHGAPAEIRQSEQWQQVRALHADFHREAARVLSLALSGRSAEARQSMEHGGPFTVCSGRLIEALRQWKQSCKHNGSFNCHESRKPTTLTAADLDGCFVDDPIPMPPPEANPIPRFRT